MCNISHNARQSTLLVGLLNCFVLSFFFNLCCKYGFLGKEHRFDLIRNAFCKVKKGTNFWRLLLSPSLLSLVICKVPLKWQNLSPNDLKWTSRASYSEEMRIFCDILQAGYQVPHSGKWGNVEWEVMMLHCPNLQSKAEHSTFFKRGKISPWFQWISGTPMLKETQELCIHKLFGACF